jgi:hypothetical protein
MKDFLRVSDGTLVRYSAIESLKVKSSTNAVESFYYIEITMVSGATHWINKKTKFEADELAKIITETIKSLS